MGSLWFIIDFPIADHKETTYSWYSLQKLNDCTCKEPGLQGALLYPLHQAKWPEVPSHLRWGTSDSSGGLWIRVGQLWIWIMIWVYIYIFYLFFVCLFVFLFVLFTVFFFFFILLLFSYVCQMLIVLSFAGQLLRSCGEFTCQKSRVCIQTKLWSVLKKVSWSSIISYLQSNKPIDQSQFTLF